MVVPEKKDKRRDVRTPSNFFFNKMKRNKLWSILTMFVLMFGITIVFSGCGSDDDLANSGNIGNGKPRKDYGYLKNGKRLAKMAGYTFQYSEEGVIKVASDGYYTYTFADDLSTVTKRRANGAVVEYALYYNKDGNVSAMGNVATNDADTKNITCTLLYQNGVCIGTKNADAKTIELDGVKYTQGCYWLDGCPVYHLKWSSTSATLRKFECKTDNPLRQNSYVLALKLWGETDVRSILQVLGFLGDGPAKFITNDDRTEWRSSDDGNTYTFNSGMTGELHNYTYGYNMENDMLMLEYCRELQDPKWKSNYYEYSYE